MGRKRVGLRFTLFRVNQKGDPQKAPDGSLAASGNKGIGTCWLQVQIKEKGVIGEEVCGQTRSALKHPNADSCQRPTGEGKKRMHDLLALGGEKGKLSSGNMSICTEAAKRSGAMNPPGTKGISDSNVYGKERDMARKKNTSRKLRDERVRTEKQ